MIKNETAINETKNASEIFTKTVKKKFKIDLDYSEESLVAADDLITLFFKKHRKHFYRAAVLIGSYLGSVIINNLGGKWNDDHSIRKVGKIKVLIKPMAKARRRLGNGLPESLVVYYRMLKANSCFDLSFAPDRDKIKKMREVLVKNKCDTELLKRVLDELEPRYVREEAAELLSRIHSEKLLPQLLNALKKAHLVYYAGIALQGFKDTVIYEPVMQALKKTKNNAVKMQLLLALGSLGDKRCIGDIIKYLESDDEILCHYASIAIGKIGGDEALNYLLDIVGGLKKGNRLYAVSALELMRDKRSVPALIEVLFSRDDNVREAAVRALQFIPDERAFKPLLYLLRDSSPSIKVLSAYALANINRDEALDAVRALLKDEVELVREHADNIIKHIESGHKEMLKCV